MHAERMVSLMFCFVFCFMQVRKMQGEQYWPETHYEVIAAWPGDRRLAWWSPLGSKVCSLEYKMTQVFEEMSNYQDIAFHGRSQI